MPNPMGRHSPITPNQIPETIAPNMFRMSKGTERTVMIAVSAFIRRGSPFEEEKLLNYAEENEGANNAFRFYSDQDKHE